MTDDTHLLQAEIADLRRRLAETERRLERAQRIGLLGQLTAGVVHDLGNLITPMLAASSLLVRTIEPRTPAAALAGEVLSTAARSAALIHRILGFLRGEAPRPEVLSLEGVLVDMLRFCGASSGATSTMLAIGDDVGETLVDRQQLEQVILNLAANARDAMPTGGMLTIRTANVDAAHVALSVSDTGSGMTPETQALAFEGLFTTKGEGGTGLGLAAVRYFAAARGGQVTAWSKLGVGTTVTLHLPRVASASAETASDGASAGAECGTAVASD